MTSEDQRLKKVRHRHHVVKEIIEFEEKFVEDLSIFNEVVVDPLLQWIEEVETQSSAENIEISNQQISPFSDDSIDVIKALLNSLKNYVLGFAKLVKKGLTEVYNDSNIKAYFDNNMQTVDLGLSQNSCPIAFFLKKGNIIPFYGMYTPYILNYDSAMEKIVQLRKARPDFHVFLGHVNYKNNSNI